MMGKLTKYILLVVVCVVIPSALVWNFLPSMLGDYPKVYNIVHRVTAIYMTIVTTWLLISFANSFRALGEQHKLPHQQYLNSFISVLKIVLIFIAVIVVIAIVLDKDPSTLIAGLGAASAILMLAFQDTIKGLVAGIRLASNDMLHIGDWITVPSAGANGKVEEISLTTVKVRNFDNTIVTVSPQALVDGSFQNWQGMLQNEGRKQVRQVYFDFRSLKIDDDGVANITKFRSHIEDWLKAQEQVAADKPILVRQADASQTGCCVEIMFWLKAQNVIDYEHDTSNIMEYIFAKSADFGLRIYQQFPEQ
jgi:miniconductance mechanosensitive channel